MQTLNEIIMAIKFDLYENPDIEGIAVPKFHARVITKDVITTKNLRESINKKCTVAPADVAAVLTALSQEMCEALSNGYSVHLDGLGHFSLGLKCSSDVNPKHVLSSDISIKNVRFIPEKDFSEKLKLATFERSVERSRHSDRLDDEEIIERVNDYFKQATIMRRPDFEKITGFTKSKSLRVLKQLLKMDVISNIGTDRQPIYVKHS